MQLVGGTNQMLGNIVYANFSTDLPFAAAVALLPLIVMAAYLLTIRRTAATPARWPSGRAIPRDAAHRPLPSSNIATCSREDFSGGLLGICLSMRLRYLCGAVFDATQFTRPAAQTK